MLSPSASQQFNFFPLKQQLDFTIQKQPERISMPFLRHNKYSTTLLSRQCSFAVSFYVLIHSLRGQEAENTIDELFIIQPILLQEHAP